MYALLEMSFSFDALGGLLLRARVDLTPKRAILRHQRGRAFGTLAPLPVRKASGVCDSCRNIVKASSWRFVFRHIP